MNFINLSLLIPFCMALLFVILIAINENTILFFDFISYSSTHTVLFYFVGMVLFWFLFISNLMELLNKKNEKVKTNGSI